MNSLESLKSEFQEYIGYFSTSIGKEKIYFKRLQNPNSQFNLICVHDMAYHHGGFDNFLENFRKKKYEGSINFLDLKGHGLSNGIRVHVENFDEYSFDLAKFLNMDFFSNEVKNIVMANGVGALIPLNLLFFHHGHLKKKLDGIILINPLLKWNNFWAQKSIQVKNILIKELGLLKYPYKIDGYDLIDDLAEAERFNSDSLVNHFLTISLFSEIVKAGERNRPFSYYLDIPCLFLHSRESKIVDSRSFDIFLKGINKSILEYEIYDGWSHDLLNSKNRKNVFNRIEKWLQKISKGEND